MLSHPQISRARDIFRRVRPHQNGISAHPNPIIKVQLDSYLDHLSSHMGKKIAKKDRERICQIIDRNNQVAKILEDSSFRKTINIKKELSGEASVGVVFCIDGRIPTIFLGGRYVCHWEEPAGQVTVIKRNSDGHLIPESSELSEALRNMAFSGKDLLEIVFAHTSLSDPHHGCGAMAAKKKAGLIPKDASLEDANLKILNEETIPAITNLFNEFRNDLGKSSLKQVGISALYDTDTFGIILNYQKRDQKGYLSTTVLTTQFKDQIDIHFLRENLFYGMYHEKFSELSYLIVFSQNLVKVAASLMKNNEFSKLQETVKDYIKTNYPNLNENQKRALTFFLFRNMAFQYLTGLSSIPKNGLEHPFAEHEEEYMAVSTRGNTIGKFDPKYQGFASTPADAATAIQHIKVKISLMNAQKNQKNKPYILFVCNPIQDKNPKSDDIQLHRAMTSNSQVLRDILTDEELGKMVDKGEIIPVPVLITDDTREVLTIADHSAYI